MALQHYLRAVLADDPQFFYPLQWTAPYVDLASHGAPALQQGAAPLAFGLPRPFPGVGGFMRIPGNDYIASASASAVFYNASFTFECWAYLDNNVDGQNVIASIATTGAPVNFMFDHGPGFLRFYISDSTGGGDFFNATIDRATLPGGYLFKPLHLVGSTDTTRSDFWINGRLVASDTTAGGSRFTTSPTSLWIGRYNATFTTYLQGGVMLVAGYHRYDASLADRHYRAARAIPHGLFAA